MTEYYKRVNGNRVEMTPDEIAKRQSEEAAYQSEQEYKEWVRQISQYDQWVDRKLEETIDAVGKESFSAFIQQKYDEKKSLRSTQPS
jgi:hypothetical protein